MSLNPAEPCEVCRGCSGALPLRDEVSEFEGKLKKNGPIHPLERFSILMSHA